MALSDKEQKAKAKELEQAEYKVVGEKGLHEDNHDFKKGDKIWLTPRRAKQINTGEDAKGNPTETKIVEPVK